MRRREPCQTRTPHAARPHRMARLATLPLFFKLQGKRVVIAGGNEAAAWKAELLSAAGATVEVWAAEPCAEMAALADEPPGGPVLLERQAWEAASFADAELVVGAANDEDEARRMFAAAGSAGVPINVIDRPAFCSFRFGAVVNRSPLVVGISTDGAAPMFGQAIRSRIEALLPAGLARWTEAALAWRRQLQGLNRGGRWRFWDGFATLALREPDRAPNQRDRDRLLCEARAGKEVQGAETSHETAHEMGRVLLVGAGPGDPELLTLSAVRALRLADIILHDDLVAPEILDFARREAKRMLVGKSGHRPSCRQHDISALMIRLARAGKRVVRLKGGDPLIFGRAGEEIAALERANIPHAVVPGITAVQGAAARLKVSLTQRGGARRLQLITGHAHDGRLPDDLDFDALADAAATTAIYMPLGTLDVLTERLLAHGVEPERPAWAVFNATRPQQRVISGTLATIRGLIEATNTTGPCLLLVGRALRRAHSTGAPSKPAKARG
jgi:uroporphyrin-III C-methyltransferase / precorrin-2 dehydrogenase / sirohydrochlorin ferrochelatase